jgi:hypothetical protein
MRQVRLVSGDAERRQVGRRLHPGEWSAHAPAVAHPHGDVRGATAGRSHAVSDGNSGRRASSSKDVDGAAIQTARTHTSRATAAAAAGLVVLADHPQRRLTGLAGCGRQPQGTLRKGLRSGRDRPLRYGPGPQPEQRSTPAQSLVCRRVTPAAGLSIGSRERLSDSTSELPTRHNLVMARWGSTSETQAVGG